MKTAKVTGLSEKTAHQKLALWKLDHPKAKVVSQRSEIAMSTGICTIIIEYDEDAEE
jgi:hypothetical protein